MFRDIVDMGILGGCMSALTLQVAGTEYTVMVEADGRRWGGCGLTKWQHWKASPRCCDQRLVVHTSATESSHGGNENNVVRTDALGTTDLVVLLSTWYVCVS